jgi:bacterioferritin
MKGSAKIIKALNNLLVAELSSVHQYFIHSEMYKDWGIEELYERIHHEMQDEQGHATLLIQRILFLEGTPNVGVLEPLKIGKDVKSMLKNDLDYEIEVRSRLLECINLCEKDKDFETREILETLLEDTEADHIYWLEQQLKLIKMMGLANYIQLKSKGGAAV